ncbi:hypothetical protein PRIPAC_87898 [Pristionchus pacificus]|uniref:Uncharacterized protein n=1 Tax=Pristionchus pacificus TaxID=54126 RepID=A0A2A6CYE2_PRIPA|nr:hypothetical protein PRIPAC_87898 [Pristionchus pacificus]|eukprot:PDM83043.1 hypothetical protein PRIPAC_37436 [Pristionchus pacificus]
MADFNPAEFKPTPEIIERFNAGRALIKAKPTMIDSVLAKLSPAAHAPAKKFLDLVLSDEEDLNKFRSAFLEIREETPEEVRNELRSHRSELIFKLGFAYVKTSVARVFGMSSVA